MPKIRLARPEDAPRVSAIYAPYVRETAITFEDDPPDEREMRARISDIMSYSTYLVCEAQGCVRAYAYGSRFRSRVAYQWSTEVTVYVEPDWHRRGLGRALYASLLSCLRVQGYVVAVGAIALPNVPSVTLHEQFGFRERGISRAIGYKLGRWHDVGWYELELRPIPEGPGPLRSSASLEAVADAEWRQALASGAALLRNDDA